MELIGIVFIHRHVYPNYSQHVYPYLWQDCHKSPILHAFYQSLEHQSSINPGKSILLTLESETPPTLNISQLDQTESFKHVQIARNLSKTLPGYCFYGQLTDTGKRNMMALGARLRFHYVKNLKLLSEHLDPKSLYIRSTDYSRTIESVQYLLGGLYPVKNREIGQDLLIHVRDYSKETMIPHTNCQSLLQDTLKRKNTLYFETYEAAKEAFKGIQHLGLPDANIENRRAVHRIYDFLACLKGHGILYPYNISKSNLMQFEKLCVQQWCNIYQDESIAKRAIGRFLPEIKEKISEIVSGPDLKMAIFSGHDSTIAPLLSAFKVFDGSYPNFASNITFEIYRERRDFYVKMLYNGNYLLLPWVSQDLCKLNDFYSYLDSMTPENYELECKCDQVINPDWDD